MAEQKKEEIIRFRYKKVGGHGHHGGAWKVAYADFVTALMALFIVLWLTSQSAQVKLAISDYFKEPGKHKTERIEASKIKSIVIARGDKWTEKVTANNEPDKNDIIMAIQEFRNVFNNMRTQVDEDGVKLELADTQEMTFFDEGTAAIPRNVELKLRKSLRKMGILPYPMIIEGHTDASPSQSKKFTNWELSMARANAVRRIVEDEGTAKVVAVKAYGGTRLLKPHLPYDKSNRRVNLLVKIPKRLFF